MTQLTFLDFHKPVLREGVYTVTAKLEASGPDITAAKPFDDKFDAMAVTFQVGGKLTGLRAPDVVSVYPPEGSDGDYSTVLPHIVLSGAARPFERDVNDQLPAAPCVALLLLTDRELTANGSPAAFVAAGGGPSDPPAIEQITLDNDQLLKGAPPGIDLSLLTHVRLAQTASGTTERAVVLCSRLPRVGAQNNCLLIDITSLYGDGKNIAAATGQTTVSVLKRWSFVSTKHQYDFRFYMDQLEPGVGPLSLPDPATGPDAATPLRRAGYVLLPMRWRDGSKGAGLYHGPLLGARPGQVPSPPAPERPDPFAQISSDALMEFHAVTGLFDVSYAAAWELGRLLALASGGMSAGLAAHKRNQQRAAITVQRVSPSTSLMALSMAQRPKDTGPAVAVKDFVQALARLQGLPFRYLVPSEKILPAESFRVFAVDMRWVDCLVAGALSLCRGPNDHPDPTLRPSGPYPVCGAIIRSNVLTDWPSLIIEGFVRSTTPATAIQPSGTVQLSPSVMLVVFDKQVTQIDMHPHPEVLHHGVEAHQGWGPNQQLITSLVVDLRQLTGELAHRQVPAVLASPDRLDMTETAKALGTALGQAQSPPSLKAPAGWRDNSSAAIAMQFIQGTPRGSFPIDWT